MNHRLLWQRLALRFLIFALITVALFYMTPFIWHILGPFILGIAIAAMLQPLVRALKKAHIPRGISSLILILLFFSIVLLLLYWFSSFVVQQALNALANSPQWSSELMNVYMDFREWITKTFRDVQDLDQLDNIMNRILGEITTWAGDAVRIISSGTIRLASMLPSVFIFANFLLLGSFFLTRDYETLPFHFRKDEPLSQSQQMMRSAAAAVGGYLRMQLIYTAFVMIVSVIGFTTFGIPYGFLISALAALLEFLPLFGNGTLYVPMILICLLLGEYRTALVTLVVHAILYITRKVTEPRMMKAQMGLNPVLSLLSLYVGMQTGGVVGLTLAPIMMEVLQEAWRSGFFKPAEQDIRDGFRIMCAFLRREDDPADSGAKKVTNPARPGRPAEQQPKPAEQTPAKPKRKPRVRA